MSWHLNILVALGRTEICVTKLKLTLKVCKTSSFTVVSSFEEFYPELHKERK